MSRKVTKYPDGSIKVHVRETRTPEEVLNELSFADKLAILYPTKTTEAEITKGWEEFDNHKRVK